MEKNHEIFGEAEPFLSLPWMTLFNLLRPVWRNFVALAAWQLTPFSGVRQTVVLIQGFGGRARSLLVSGSFLTSLEPREAEVNRSEERVYEAPVGS